MVVSVVMLAALMPAALAVVAGIGLGADLTGVVGQVLAPEQVSLWLS